MPPKKPTPETVGAPEVAEFKRLTTSRTMPGLTESEALNTVKVWDNGVKMIKTSYGWQPYLSKQTSKMKDMEISLNGKDLGTLEQVEAAVTKKGGKVLSVNESGMSAELQDGEEVVIFHAVEADEAYWFVEPNPSKTESKRSSAIREARKLMGLSEYGMDTWGNNAGHAKHGNENGVKHPGMIGGAKAKCGPGEEPSPTGGCRKKCAPGEVRNNKTGQCVSLRGSKQH